MTIGKTLQMRKKNIKRGNRNSRKRTALIARWFLNLRARRLYLRIIFSWKVKIKIWRRQHICWSCLSNSSLKRKLTWKLQSLIMNKSCKSKRHCRWTILKSKVKRVIWTNNRISSCLKNLSRLQPRKNKLLGAETSRKGTSRHNRML